MNNHIEANTAKELIELNKNMGHVAATIENLQSDIQRDRIETNDKLEKMNDTIACINRKVLTQASFTQKIKHSWIIASIFGSIAGATAGFLIKIDKVKNAVGGFFNNGS